MRATRSMSQMRVKHPVLAGMIATLGVVFFLALLGRPPEKKRLHLHADKILVEKAHRRLTLFWKGAPVKSYHVALGGSPVGGKQCQGDHRTPEGHYRIDARNAQSSYHLALHVSYPNAEDAAAAGRRRCHPGGDIMIHGIRNGYGWIGTAHTKKDWTQGCIAVTDPEIEEIWEAAPNGTAVEIRP